MKDKIVVVTGGFGSAGRLGNNAITNQSSPVQTISGGTNWKQVSLGALHSGAIKTDGSLWLWGDGGFGRLGTNATISQSSPVQTISGGTNWKQVSVGRVIAAIPALEKFHRLNPNDDFKVFVYGWESLYWSHPLLQKRTFSIGQKGVFDLFIKDSNLIVPEPYDRRSYYTQQKSLAETFDEEINKTNDHSDLGKPSLYLQKQELMAVQSMLEKKKQELKKDKVIVFQPYGSGMKMVNDRPHDTSIRSLDVDDYLRIAKRLSDDALIVYFGEKDYIHPGDNFSFKPAQELQVDLRFWMACIKLCDYFVGVDSVGQHMAYSFNKPGTVIMGSTFEKNVTYSDHFHIYRNGQTPTYNPIRIGAVDCEFADRSNDTLMDFTPEHINEVCTVIKSKLNSTTEWRW